MAEKIAPRKRKRKIKSSAKKATAQKAKKKESSDSFIDQMAAQAKQVLKGADGSVYLGSNSELGQPKMFVSTGIPEFDAILHEEPDKGWPMGRIIEIFGDSATGKSGIGCSFGAAVQKAGGLFFVLLAEGEYSSRLAEKYDVDPEKVLLIDTNIVEDAFEFIYKLLDDVDPELPVCILLDSVAGLCTKAEYADGKFDQDRAAQMRAQLISKSLRKVGAKIPRTNVTLFLINQVNEGATVGVFKSKPKPPGGKRIAFYCTIRLRLENMGKIYRQKDKVERVRGFKVKVTTEKNRLADQFQECLLKVDFDHGLQPLAPPKKKARARAVENLDDDGSID